MCFLFRLLFLHSLVISCLSQSVAFEDWTSGISTYYSGIDGGHCSYGSISTSSFPNGYIVAPNSLTYDDSNACGRCYEVQCLSSTTAGCNGCYTDSDGSNSKITVQVTDECPSCEDSANQFDLSQTAFELIADTTCGVINIQYRQVSCDINSNIIIQNKDGVNAWWYALYVKNVANYGEISNVEIKDNSNNANWVTGKSTVYNAWIFTSSSGFQTPLSVRLTDSSGTILTGSDIISDLIGDNEFNFGQNFDVDSSSTDTQSPTDKPSNNPTIKPTNEPTNKPTDTPASGDDDNSGDIDDTLEPTTKPTVGPTVKPTDKPSDEPTDGPVTVIDVDNDNNIIIQNKDGINKWWYAFYVQNVADGYEINKIELKDSNLDYYTIGDYTSYYAYVFQSSNGGWVLPFTLRITSKNGDILESKDVITNIDEYSQFDFGENFKEYSLTANSDGSSGNNGDETDTNDSGSDGAKSNNNGNKTKNLKDEISLLEWLLVGAIVLFVFVCFVFTCCWIRKRKSRSNIYASDYVQLDDA